MTKNDTKNDKGSESPFYLSIDGEGRCSSPHLENDAMSAEDLPRQNENGTN